MRPSRSPRAPPSPAASLVGKALPRREPSTSSLVHRELAFRAASYSDPLSLAERRAISASIRGEIANAAVDILRVEQETKSKLHAVHIKCISLMVVALVAMGVSMIYLRVVLVPFILAIFFMFVLEPLLFALLGLPGCFARTALVQNYMKKFERRPGQQDRAPCGVDDDQDCDDTCGVAGAVKKILTIARNVWNLVAVATCLLVLLSACTCVVYFLVRAFDSFPWDKYAKSPKVQLILDVFPEITADPDDLNFETLLPWLLQGPLFNALDMAFSIISQAFLMLLFLAFLLANDVQQDSGDDVWGIGNKVRTSVRRYIRIKTTMATLVSVVVWGLLWYIGVDLFFVFAFVTFVLYYIPHVGNTVSVIAPLPLVFLDPNMSWGNLVTVFFVPFTVHQLATNLVEPKLLASSLDLHPIVVLISLAFWTTVWGAMGAVLSVPLTAVLRLILLEMEHPYAKPLVWLLKGQISDTVQKSGHIPENGQEKWSPTPNSPSFSMANDNTARMPKRFVEQESHTVASREPAEVLKVGHKPISKVADETLDATNLAATTLSENRDCATLWATADCSI